MRQTPSISSHEALGVALDVRLWTEIIITREIVTAASVVGSLCGMSISDRIPDRCFATFIAGDISRNSPRFNEATYATKNQALIMDSGRS